MWQEVVIATPVVRACSSFHVRVRLGLLNLFPPRRRALLALNSRLAKHLPEAVALGLRG